MNKLAESPKDGFREQEFIPGPSFRTEDKARVLSEEFHSTFPDAGVDTVIHFGQTGWTINFMGDMSEEISAWLKSKQTKV